MQLGEQLAAKGIDLSQAENTEDSPGLTEMDATAPDSAEPDMFNGEDEEHWNQECQKRLGDAYQQKAKDTQRRTEARTFYESDEYNLTGALNNKEEERLYFKTAKLLVTTLIGTLAENGFDTKIIANCADDIPDPQYQQIAQQYAQQSGLSFDDQSTIISELLTHALTTLDEKQHLPILLQKWIEDAFVDSTGAAYCYTGVSLYSNDVVVKEPVPADQMWLDPNAQDFYQGEWFCRMWPITLERLIAKFPQYKEYFEENKKQGRDKNLAPDDKKNASLFAPDYVQEHWFRNWEFIEGEQVPKYPGHWMQIWRYGNKILKISPNPHLHEETPYDQLLGVTKQGSAQGISFVLDVLYGTVMAENRALNAAVETSETIGRGKRLLQIDALENPDDAYDNSISNLLVRPGFKLDECVYNLLGADISPSVKSVVEMMQQRFPLFMGQTPPAGAEPDTNGDAAHAGRAQAPFRTRLRDFLGRIAKKEIFDLIQFDYLDRAWRTMGGYGPSIVRYRPDLFRPLIESMESYFTVEVRDRKPSVTDPVKQADIQERMIKLAKDAAVELGVPYSKALSMGPEFEGKDRMVREARIAEAEKQRAIEAAKAAGQPDPMQAQIMAKNAAARGDGLAEVAKKNIEDLSKVDAKAVAKMLMTGATTTIFKIAQGELQPINDLKADQVLHQYFGAEEEEISEPSGAGGAVPPPQPQPGPTAPQGPTV